MCRLIGVYSPLSVIDNVLATVCCFLGVLFYKEIISMETIPRVQHDTDLLRTITKPIDDIDKLIRCLAPKCNQMLMDGRRNIGIVKENQHQCLVLFRGTMSLYRNNDGLIINSETSPFIFGMNSQLRYSRHIYLRTRKHLLLA
jgi:hypothetical protein